MADTGKSDPRPTKSPKKQRLLNFLRKPPSPRGELRRSDKGKGEERLEPEFPEMTKGMRRRMEHELEKFEQRQHEGTESEGVGSVPEKKGPPPRPRRPAPRRPLPTNLSTLKVHFDLDNLESLKKKVNRGGLKGAGDFGKVIDFAKKLYDKKVDSPEKEGLVLTELAKKLSSYLEDHPEPSTDNPSEPLDDIARLKINSAKNMLRQVRLRQQDVLNIQYGPALSSTAPSEREPAASKYATAMLKLYGTGEPMGGTSDVYLIKNASDQVAFAFKSIEGESSQIRTPKGSGAVRESMASTFSDTIREQTGLDFGFPKVDITRIGDRQGALVEGMTGQVLSLEGLMKQYEDGKITSSQFAQMRVQFGQIAERTPPKQLQKALMCNLAMAQFDIKWDNMMVDDANGGVVRPFDAGAGFPPRENLKNDVNKIKVPGSFLINNPFTNKPLPVANEPLDPELVEQFMSINVDKLELSMKQERERLAREQKLSPELIGDDALQSSLTSTRIIQEILRENPEITTAAFLEAYGRRMVALVN